MVCLAATGAGKTRFVARALVQEILHAPEPCREQRQEPPAFLVVDPKNDLIEAILAGLALAAPARLSDAVLLDPLI